MFIHTNQWALSMVRGCGLSYSFRAVLSVACIVPTRYNRCKGRYSYFCRWNPANGCQPKSFLREKRGNYFLRRWTYLAGRGIDTTVQRLESKRHPHLSWHQWRNLERQSWGIVKSDGLGIARYQRIQSRTHRTLTGRSNEQTLRTAAWLEQQGHPFWLRYVLVPGYSDFEEDIRNMGEQLGKYQSIQRVENTSLPPLRSA